MELNKTADSLISLDMIAMLLSDLNKELIYKLTEYINLTSDMKPLTLYSDGDNHSILFLGDLIWDSATEKQIENIPVREEIELNERKYFESHLRLLINDRVLILKNLEM